MDAIRVDIQLIQYREPIQAICLPQREQVVIYLSSHIPSIDRILQAIRHKIHNVFFSFHQPLYVYDNTDGFQFSKHLF